VKIDRTIINTRVVIVLTGLVLTLLVRGSAHDIPNDVTVQAFVKPEGQRLNLLVRIPLRACRDVDFPTRGPGYLDIARADASLRDAATLWIADNIELFEGDARLRDAQVIAARVSLESQRAFESYQAALEHARSAKLGNDTEVYWNQALLDVLFDYPIQSQNSLFAVRPEFSRLGIRVVTVLRFLPQDGVVRAFEFEGDPGLVRLDPRWYQSASRFVAAGFRHILDGTDHLLFLFCLVIPFRRFRPLLMIVTAFTVAHSVKLIASAYNLGPDALWFPPLIETLIAVSIVYMALENIVGSKVERRWMIALGFGLVHGFGFSFALKQTMQFAGSHLLTSLLSFNVGVELGQLLVLVLLIPLLELLFKFVVAERVGTIILSAIVAHTGWHWMLERGSRLSQFGWPGFNAANLASALRWLMVIITVAALSWILYVIKDRLKSGDSRTPDDVANQQPFMIQATNDTNPKSTNWRTSLASLIARIRPARPDDFS
jgi:hypothetical protein